MWYTDHKVFRLHCGKGHNDRNTNKAFQLPSRGYTAASITHPFYNTAPVWGQCYRSYGVSHKLSTWFILLCTIRPCFYQTRSAWSADQGSNKNHSPAYNFAPTVTKFCVMWEGQALPHHTKFGNCRYKIVDSRAFLSWSLIHGLRWSGLIKAEPG